MLWEYFDTKFTNFRPNLISNSINVSSHLVYRAELLSIEKYLVIFVLFTVTQVITQYVSNYKVYKLKLYSRLRRVIFELN